MFIVQPQNKLLRVLRGHQKWNSSIFIIRGSTQPQLNRRGGVGPTTGMNRRFI